MLGKVLNFVKYNNAFTIIFVMCFLGVGVSYASPVVRDSVYASEETIVSINNDAIINADLDNFSFNLRIDSVTEDEKNYYATYSYLTLTVLDGVWQNKEIGKTLTASKEALDGKDFGLYLARELGENINYELSYLKRVQKLEREKGESQKVVTVEYSGLIGKLLDPKEMVIEGYDPVIPEPVPEVPVTVEANPQEVIVSTPYTEPQDDPAPTILPLSEPAPASTTPPVELAPEATSTPPQVEPTPEPTPLPAPEEMVDEELVQEVVAELLQDEPAPTLPTPTESEIVTPTESVEAEPVP